MAILFLVLAESKIECGWEDLAIITLFIIQFIIQLAMKATFTDVENFGSGKLW